jgi:hypothetical protein
MIIKPGQKKLGATKQEDFVSFIESKGFKPTCPDFTRRTDMKRKVFKETSWTKLAGVALLLTLTWTVFYDDVSKSVMEVKREVVATDTVSSHEMILATVVFLTTTGGSTWTFDATWNNSDNTIEAIGTGAAGRNGVTGKISAPGGAGGGGAYARLEDQTLAANQSYTIAANPAANGAAPVDTTFGSGPLLIADSGANGSVPSPGGPGGTVANSTGTTEFAGGTGGSGGGGGGGAAGPSGAGGNGAAGNAGAAGGTGNGGTTPAATAGTHWNGTHGAGGGGTGATNASGADAPDNAGLYGAGGGGGGAGSGGISAAGRQGIIVLTWTPAVTASASYAVFL